LGEKAHLFWKLLFWNQTANAHIYVDDLAGASAVGVLLNFTTWASSAKTFVYTSLTDRGTDTTFIWLWCW
jgi:hypothetical protein